MSRFVAIALFLVAVVIGLVEIFGGNVSHALDWVLVLVAGGLLAQAVGG